MQFVQIAQDWNVFIPAFLYNLPIDKRMFFVGIVHIAQIKTFQFKNFCAILPMVKTARGQEQGTMSTARRNSYIQHLFFYSEQYIDNIIIMSYYLYIITNTYTICLYGIILPIKR